MILKLLIDGGDMKPGPAIAQQLGPKGINMGKVITQVNDSTKGFKGMKVPVELDINEKTKEFVVHVSSPPTSELLKKEFSLEKGSEKISEKKVANASIEDIVKIALIKHPNLLDKDLKKAVKSVLGTCASVGILVENKNASEVSKEVDAAVYDAEIKAEKTVTSQEKRNQLNEYMQQVKAVLEAKALALKKAEEEEAKAAEEAAKAGGAPSAAAATPATKTPTAATPTAGAKPAEKAPATKAAAKPLAKPAEKKK